MTFHILGLLALVATTASAVSPVAGNSYTISPISFPSLCLAAGGTTNGSPVVTAACSTAGANVWTYTGGTFVNTATNMCVDVKDGITTNGNKLQVWDCFANNRNQAFTPTAAASGDNVNWNVQNSCWDLTDGSSSIGTSVQMWTCFAENTNQRWNFVDASGSTPPPPPSSPPPSSSGYLRVSGNRVVDPNGNAVVLHGTNLGGWLVFEDWMCGISDESHGDREAQVTLEDRFGIDQTRALMNAWEDNWITSADFDNIQGLGLNVVRVPFSYRNFKRSDGSYWTDSNGNVDFSRLDWVVAQAKSRGIYVILDYHIWEGQLEQGTPEYEVISQPGSQGDVQRAQAAELWGLIAAHFVGEGSIAAFDSMNEVTGSPGDILQIAMYNAIRANDPNRIVIMESVHADPSSYGWTNVLYSYHEYDMMGSDLGSNQQTYQSEVQSYIDQSNAWNIPSYVGEFMVTGDTATWMLGQMNSAGIWYSGWTYATVDRGDWGLFNFPASMHVDVSSDSYDTILSTWSNMGSKSQQNIANIYRSAVARRSFSDREVEAPVYLPVYLRRSQGQGHGGRSRRARGPISEAEQRVA